MGELDDIRARLDEIDEQIFDLFVERTSMADQIGAYKRANNLRVFDPAREREKVLAASQQVPEDMRTYAQVMMQLLMEASRMRQARAVGPADDTLGRIQSAISSTPPLFPTSSFVACQGVEGAYSQIATERIFKHPSISYLTTFDGVFRAVEQGFCDYGVLPIENSTAGSVNQVYDLMMAHDFHIVRTVRLKIDHNLMAKPGVTLEQVRHVYSHQQAISQCSHYLASLPQVSVHVCENTAMAAKAVAESSRTDVAALSSRACADLYGLSILERSVQDSDGNYTRFACIAKDLAIYPGADRTSLMLVVNHEPGSLYKVLAKFYALDINIIKLESRPIPGRDFEFMFYFDIECPVAAPEFQKLMATLPNLCQELRYLGSYVEVV